MGIVEISRWSAHLSLDQLRMNAAEVGHLPATPAISCTGWRRPRDLTLTASWARDRAGLIHRLQCRVACSARESFSSFNIAPDSETVAAVVRHARALSTRLGAIGEPKAPG